MDKKYYEVLKEKHEALKKEVIESINSYFKIEGFENAMFDLTESEEDFVIVINNQFDEANGIIGCIKNGTYQISYTGDFEEEPYKLEELSIDALLFILQAIQEDDGEWQNIKN